VYAQVTDLFQGAPDLLDEFSQFLPTADGSQPQQGGLFGDFFGPPAPVVPVPEARPAFEKPGKRGPNKQEKEGGQKKRRMADKEGKGRVSWRSWMVDVG
jgi:paired amphipathic helix protein Sin3a